METQPTTHLIFATMLLAIALASCTSTPEIIIDQKGVNMSRYEADLEDCQSYSQQVQVSQKTAKGAASGAAVGGAIGAVSQRSDTSEGAAIGAITGGAKGLNEGERDKIQVVKNCLRGRGYKVLN